MSAVWSGPGADVLVVDDQHEVVDVLTRILEADGHVCRGAHSAADAYSAVELRQPDLVLCDIDMPGESGLSLAGRLQASWPDVAVLMVTALDDPDVAGTALDNGAIGYVIKPFERNEILINVASALRHRRRNLETRREVDDLHRAVSERTAELHQNLRRLEQASQELDRTHEGELRRLALAAELRDPETATHLERMSRYSEVLARAAGLAPEHCELIRMASPMHDVGKIGISDDVLLKEGIFTSEDRRTMQRHAQIGHDLLQGSGTALLDLAATIALHHHEKVDGSGYPRGLRGEEISVEGRIVAIADVFDALTSERRYKDAMTYDEARRVMLEGRGSHFDADLLDRFFECADELELIRRRWSERDAEALVS
jgi:putative two-component system response regulator